MSEFPEAATLGEPLSGFQRMSMVADLLALKRDVWTSPG